MRKFVILMMIFIFAFGTASADDEIRIGVMEFSSGTMELVPEQAIVVGNIFTQRLAMSAPDNVSIIGHGYLSRIAEDNKMSTEGYVSNRDAAKIGRLAGCKYIIAGIVTDLKTRRASTGVNMIIKLGRTIDVATAGADIRLVDAETGEAVLAYADIARATQRDSSFNFQTDTLPKKWQAKLPKDTPPTAVDFGRSDLHNSMQAASMYLLSYKLSLRVIETITGEYPKVTGVSAKEVVLGAGTREGARTGMLYRILTGDGEDIAVVQVKEAGEHESRATVYAKSYGNISFVRKGDRIFPTDIYEAAPLVKNKLFIKSRPSQSVESRDTDILLRSLSEHEAAISEDVTPAEMIKAEPVAEEVTSEESKPKKSSAKRSSSRKKRRK